MNEPKTALATISQIKSGAPVLGIIPRSIEEVVRLAKGIESAQLAPKGLDTWPKIMAVIMGGAELGLPPMQSLQSFALINNRLAIWGDAIPALLRSHGFKIKEWFDGQGDALTAHCEVTRPDTGEVIPGEFSVADAKTAKLWTKQGPWQEYPKRMLKMRARSWAARDGAADVLRGVQVREEVQDYQTIRDVTPPAAQLALESHEDVGEIEIVDVKPEASGLAEPVPTLSEKWAAEVRAKITEATEPHDRPEILAYWNSPAAKKDRERAKSQDGELYAAVFAELTAKIDSLREVGEVEA